MKEIYSQTNSQDAGQSEDVKAVKHNSEKMVPAVILSAPEIAQSSGEI